MAPLVTPHWEAVTPGMQELLGVLGEMPLLDVKAFFVREARRLGEAWFGDARG